MKQLDSGAQPSCQYLAAPSSPLSSMSSLLTSCFHHGCGQLQGDIPIAWQYQLRERFPVPRVLTTDQVIRLTLICPINPVTEAVTRPRSRTHPCCWGQVSLELNGLKMNAGLFPQKKKGIIAKTGGNNSGNNQYSHRF